MFEFQTFVEGETFVTSFFFLLGCFWQNGTEGWGCQNKMGDRVIWDSREKQTASAGVWLESTRNLEWFLIPGLN